MDYKNKNLDIIIPGASYMNNKSTFNNDIEKLENIYTSSQLLST